jgi:hypothetical protein
MAGKKLARAALLAAFSLAMLLIIAGCTSNKYVPCCVKGNIYMENGTALANPSCYFQNGSLYGPCKLPSDTHTVAFCNDGTQCSSLATEEECGATWDCGWNPSANPKCQGTLAYVPFPVCTDLVPKSCVNNKCTAMVCGYTNIRPAPPPASQDWDAGKANTTFTNNPNALPSNVPAQDVQLPSIGLQKVTCDFNTMNSKLYNKVKASRGALWVNSFRFGVGSSFSDFDAAKNFFPATDRACAANPAAKVDRFTVYLGDSQYCQDTSTYYKCSGPRNSDLYFKGDSFGLEQCKLYCGNGVSPYSCDLLTGQLNIRYVCNQDGIAYDTSEICTGKCSRIDDPNACANDAAQFPFLKTDNLVPQQANYRMKYVSDYMVDSRNIKYGSGGQHSQTCREVAGPESNYNYYGWIEKTINEPDHCNDFFGDPANGWSDGPWFSTYNNSYANAWKTCPPDTGCCASGDPSCDFLGQQRTYFDNHAYSALDLDYSYYKKALLWQYPPQAQLAKLPFECESSSDCISGSCDTTHYKRGVCESVPIPPSTQGTPIGCLCSPHEFGSSHVNYPACYLTESSGNPFTIYSNTNLPVENTGRPLVSLGTSGGAMFYPDASYHTQSQQPTLHFRYYVAAPTPTSDRPQFFEICQVTPVRVAKCIMKDKYVEDICEEGNPDDCKHYTRATDETVIWEPENDGKCHYTEVANQNTVVYPSQSYYWEYDFDLSSSDPAKQVNQEKFGICALNGKVSESKDPVQPYLKMKDLGWCAGCSYATLAVQKVDWGLPLPGGVGNPRQYSCYEYRGEFNYIPSPVKPPYGGGVENYLPVNGQFSNNPVNDGHIRYELWGASPSAEPVRYTSNPSAYQSDIHGNIALTWGEEGKNPAYICEDGWHASGGWWDPQEIPTPSAPYMKEKLTSLLQSNIMPILDEVSSKTRAPTQYGCTPAGFGTWYCPYNDHFYDTTYDPTVTGQDKCTAACRRLINKGYDPIAICNTMGGDGAVLHVVGDTRMLRGYSSTTEDFGSIAPSALSSDILSYLDINGAGTATFDTATGGKKAIVARTSLLKGECKTSPLVGLELLPTETQATLVGTPAAPGILQPFFFKPTEPGYAQRTARGMPDKFPDQVDLFMQDWYPLCNAAGTLYPGEREVYEFESRLDLSRALLSNFSKPSLIWKFAFPINTQCDQTFFLDYLFNHTQEMVDSGITGLIYSDWSMKDGLGYGPETQHYSDKKTYPAQWNAPAVAHDWEGDIKTGLTQEAPVVRGTASDQTYVLDDKAGGTGKTDLFCALEKYSLRSIGFISLTYGQKIYAENKTCYCTPCTGFDYISGICDLNAANSPDIPQLYCNDGTTCTMPDSGALPDASGVYNQYKCEQRCVNYTACKLCTGPENADYASFCRFSEPGGEKAGYVKSYSNITDDYWEFLTGLSASEKCCIDGATQEGMNGTKYTYVGLSGSKQQSVFLQYPTRGGLDIDCGRAPDTSVLEYCNIRVPISQKEIACMRVANSGGSTPPAPACGEPDSWPGSCQPSGTVSAVNCAAVSHACCGLTYGCGWDGTSCTGSSSSVVHCEQFDDNPSGCNAFGAPASACTWVPATCGTPGQAQGTCGTVSQYISSCSTVGANGAACCNAVTNCHWSNGACTATSPDQPYVICGNFDNNPIACNTFTYPPLSACSWAPG